MGQSTRILGPMKLRSLLIGIAIVACLLGAGDASRRRGEMFRKLALYHRWARYCVGDDFYPGPFCGNAYSSEPWYYEERAKIRKRFCQEAHDYYKFLAWKYFRATKYPWLPVAPDRTPPPLAFPKTVVDWSRDVVLARP